jgi:protein-glutamine gamma-glutamyltransferase
MKPLKLKLEVKARKRNPLEELPISKGAVTWLVLSLAVAALWHIPHLPVWSFLVAAVLGSYSYRLIIKEKPLPPMMLKILLAVASVVGIMLTYKSYLGRDPGMTALLLLSTLKLMELKSRRDFMIIVFICYFLVFGNFLYDQSIEDLAFTLTATILITGALLRLNDPETGKVKISQVLKFSLRLFAFTIPFTIILFFLFPRSSSPLWNLSQDSMKLFQSGINDILAPGEIAELAQSEIPAFQVEFPNLDMPSQQDLYFRGLVLWFTRWGRFYQGILAARYPRSQPFTGEGIVQQITLRPHNQRWLFGLDRPVAFPRYTGRLPGDVFQTHRPVKSHYRYRVISRLNSDYVEPLTETHRQWALQLPREDSRRLIQLGRSWRTRTTDDRELLNIAERYIRTGNFVYSLNPGVMMPNNPLDDFFFNKKKGFCEHYSAAFTILMRAAGVPARLVVGYQGGQYNPVGKYLLVRQSDAHAWVEVYLEGIGWHRVDPTAWVAPDRLQYGAELSRRLSAMGDMTDDDKEEAIQNALRRNFLKKIWEFFKYHWDNINYQWDVWIISFDRYRQRDFFKGLGFEQTDRVGLFGALVIIIPSLFFLLSYFLKRQALSSDPVLRLYHRFCKKMEKDGLQRLRWEGPVHFEERAIKKFPRKEEAIRTFTQLFVHLRYGRLAATKQRLNELKRLLRKV